MHPSTCAAPFSCSPQDGLTGTAKISVPINLPPTCSSAGDAGCLSLDVSNGTFPAATFTATVAGWARCALLPSARPGSSPKHDARQRWHPAEAAT